MITTLVVAVVIAALIFALRPKGYRVDGDPRQSLIVFPFENRTGDPANDYLEEASMHLLGLAAGHWEDMRVYDDERTNSLMRRQQIDSPRDIDFDAAQAMAREARVGTMVLGDIRRQGDSLAIEAKVHDVRTGDRLATEIARAGLTADPRLLFDALAARILRVSGAPAGERPDLVSQTTRSLEAYREYLAGTRALQLMQIDVAKEHLASAVALDSTFALAYLRLRDADGWAGIEGSPAARRALVAKAQAHSETLPPRLRLLVQYYQAYEGGRMQRARAIAEQMIARDSTDVEAWYQLGEAHFHGHAGHFPHADSMGDMGQALYAFQHTLELDPSYTVAYRHVVDVLGNCGGDAPWLCFRDSTVYAPQSELMQRFGEATVTRMRRQALDARLEAARAWVAAAPASQARLMLTELLLHEDRYDEAESEIAVLRAQGERVNAAALDAQLAYLRGQYGEAGAKMRDALASAPGAFRQIVVAGVLDPGEMLNPLAGAGLMGEMERFTDMVIGVVPGDSVPGPSNWTLTKPMMRQFLDLAARASYGIGGADLARTAHRWLDSLEAHYQAGSEAYHRRLGGSGAFLLTAHLTTRDTTLLTRFIASVDTTDTRTWRAMAAHLDFERGDTAAALASYTQQFVNRDRVELAGDFGCARLLAWADLQARVGDAQAAAAALELFEREADGTDCPALHVRSWAERGALYQQLGDRTKAIENYERFIAAWERADALVQPQVARARQALAALRGETAPAPEGR